MRRMILFVLLLTSCAAQRRGIEIAPSRDVIADPAFLEQYAETRRFSAGYPTGIKLVPDGSAVLFLRSPSRSFVQDLYELNTATGEERLLLTADQILKGADEKLTPEERARRERMRLSARGIATYQLSKDGKRILVPLTGRLFVIERATGALTELKSDKGYPIDARFSPDAQSVACVRDDELFVIDIASGAERQLTSGAGPQLSHGTAEFVAQEEMDRREGYWWSPDSKSIVFQETSSEGMETMFIADAMRPDREPQSWPYPRPGKANAKVRLGLISISGGETRWIEWGRDRYPYLATVSWKDRAPLTIVVQNRTQTEELLLAVNPETGKTASLLMERDDAWLNLDNPSMPKWYPDGSAFLWTTERNSAWQLELHNRTGELIRPVTDPDFIYKGFVDVDPERKLVHLLGSDDPTQTHLYRVRLDRPERTPEKLTTQPGSHSANFSEDHRVYLHSMSTLDGQRVQTVRDIEGKTLATLRSVAEQPPFMAKIEVTTVGRNPSFHAVLVRPRNFDAKRRYPVIVSVYGGPHAQTVTSSAWGYLLSQWMADHGFIVVSLDGRGTPSRGRAWERAIKGNLIDVPLKDQADGLRALGRKYSELDLDRVGIYGWSFGGYFSAMAVMQRPDVYHAGVAGAPVADWLDYDTHYTERYMGLPDENPSGYEAASVLTHAPKLERPLLIIHGTADDNVYFAHSLKMSNALFRAGKKHEFLALSDFTHMVADPKVTRRLYQRIMAFMQEHLMNPSTERQRAGLTSDCRLPIDPSGDPGSGRMSIAPARRLRRAYGLIPYLALARRSASHAPVTVGPATGRSSLPGTLVCSASIDNRKSTPSIP